MSVKALLSKIFSLFPSGNLKDKIRVYLYNKSKGKEFSISKKKKMWIASYTGYDLKFCSDICPYHVLLTNSLFTRQFPKEPVEILVDAGAYIGSFSLFAAKKYPTIKRVIALEPDPKTFITITKNLALNNLPDFEIIPYGLWSKKDTLTFFSEQHLSSSVYDISRGKGAVQIEVDTLDDILKGVTGKRIFIKMNIEGAELEALHGCSEIIKKNKVYFAISSDHMVEGQLTQKKVEAICIGMGLSVTTFKSNQYIIVYASNEEVYSDSITI